MRSPDLRPSLKVNNAFVLLQPRQTDHTDEMHPDDTKIAFLPTKMQSYDGRYVQVVIPSLPPIQLGGFKTEDEAKEWVRRKSQTWAIFLKSAKDGSPQRPALKSGAKAGCGLR
jgi:hypothetical protein